MGTIARLSKAGRVTAALVAAITALGLTLGTGASAAHADPADDAPAVLAAPAFQLPVPCGQRWTTSTHSGHASQYMVDMISQSGATAGTPVLASAAGTVTTSTFYSDAGNTIVIDHGGGWTTRYLHMASRALGVGAVVGRGRQIGTVGSTGSATTGAHLHYEQKLNGGVVQATVDGHLIPVTWSYGQHTETSRNCDAGGPAKYWVDIFTAAPGYSSPGGVRTGTLNQGTQYVYCRAWGPIVQVGSAYNHWWLRTDLDSGNPWQNQWVSAYYLARWGNDEARDNSGAQIPDC
ncbi:M23 family peptidase [Sphaerisporangium album]|uniref:M23 family peptidase n=1 Tax=Sphaerisporangium album TaxID=509200 RepID=A0A367FHF3_9ACTN|nr:M23 family metallopeptidase [Sphaerisporangium album]RCG29786.1 M23 family peptidase [Sphaerisporangium album]